MRTASDHPAPAPSEPCREPAPAPSRPVASHTFTHAELAALLAERADPPDPIDLPEPALAEDELDWMFG